MFVSKRDLSVDEIWNHVRRSIEPPKGFYIDFEEIPDYIVEMNDILIKSSYGDTTKEMVWSYARDYEDEPDFNDIFINLVLQDFKEFCDDKGIETAKVICAASKLDPIFLVNIDKKVIDFKDCDKSLFAA